MKTSESIKELATAFVAAQAELKNATFDAKNPHFGNKYASLAGMRDGVTAILSKHGLAVIQGTAFADGIATVNTRLVHKSGEWMESVYPFAVDKPQAMGSAYTYARRYSLAAICGIASEEDDDANEGSKTAPAKPVAVASKAASRGDFDTMVKDIRKIASLKALHDWREKYNDTIDSLPRDWFDDLLVEYKDKQSELKKALAA